MPVDRSSGQRAVVLLATFIVMTGGLFVCAFIIVMFDDSPRDSLLWCGGAFLVMALLAWLLRDKPPGSVETEKHFWLRKSVAERGSFDLAQLQFQRPPSPAATGAPPAPPTAESVREIAANSNVWVPSATRSTPAPAPDAKVDESRVNP